VFIGPYEHHSNVTGVLTDTDAVSELLHRHGVLACFDYAAAGPHVPIVMMAGHRRPLASKDAAFLSPHQLPGGPGTPGVLVVRRELVRNRVPTAPGGGTITYVHATGQHYHNFVVAALNDLSASSAAAAAPAPDRTATGCWASTWTTPIGSPARPSTAGSASSRGGPG
jgi:selenocysteine lyase/cysteine desulfurase